MGGGTGTDGLGVVGGLPPGAWGPDLSHFPKPVSRATAEVLVGRLAAEASERWGLLLLGVDFAVDADGWVYVRDEPVTDGGVAEARAAAAVDTVTRRRWREEAARWNGVTRAAVVDELLALQGEPIVEADERHLADHVLRAFALARRLIDLHMELHLTDMLPLGALLAEGGEWGLTPGDILPLMRGASPASTPSPTLEAARRAVAASSGPWEELPEVRDFLRAEGHHLVSEPEVASATLHERPDLLDRLLRREETPAAAPASADTVADVRRRVPPSHRSRFDELLADARLTYGIRDDNTTLTAMWPLGLVRRAGLEAARRLPELTAPDDVFSASPQELVSLLTGAVDGGGLAAALAARTRHRTTAATATPPEAVGSWVPPDRRLMHDAQRWLHRAFDAYGYHYGGATDEPLTGIGVGDRVVCGPAVVAVSPLDALDRIGRDSILVVSATAPAYDSVLPLVAGLIVETGGLLCHAALAARELGLPAVVGVTDATRHLSEGEMVTVDPVAGRISRGTSSRRR